MSAAEVIDHGASLTRSTWAGVMMVALHREPSGVDEDVDVAHGLRVLTGIR
ncbi:hypothetical protein [Streptomyces sp. NPDC008125]|uniref:hypothetical protein n=1 Tax=Streptomyces sp. NPDC008125 TaxID=3364811 RepID=UPI0036E686C5